MKFILNEEEYNNYITSINENKKLKRNIDILNHNLKTVKKRCNEYLNYYCDNCVYRNTISMNDNSLCLLEKHKSFSK